MGSFYGDQVRHGPRGAYHADPMVFTWQEVGLGVQIQIWFSRRSRVPETANRAPKPLSQNNVGSTNTQSRKRLFLLPQLASDKIRIARHKHHGLFPHLSSRGTRRGNTSVKSLTGGPQYASRRRRTIVLRRLRHCCMQASHHLRRGDCTPGPVAHQSRRFALHTRNRFRDQVTCCRASFQHRRGSGIHRGLFWPSFQTNAFARESGH